MVCRCVEEQDLEKKWSGYYTRVKLRNSVGKGREGKEKGEKKNRN